MTELGSPPDAAQVTRSEEQLRTSLSRQSAGSVRIRKRIVTEERVITVQVRHEELVVEPSSNEGLPPAAGSDALLDTNDAHDTDVAQDAHDAQDARGVRVEGVAPVLELTLHEEVVEVITTVVPRERVRVFLDTVTREVEVTEALRHEVVDLAAVVPPAAPPPR